MRAVVRRSQMPLLNICVYMGLYHCTLVLLDDYDSGIQGVTANAISVRKYWKDHKILKSEHIAIHNL